MLADRPRLPDEVDAGRAPHVPLEHGDELGQNVAVDSRPPHEGRAGVVEVVAVVGGRGTGHVVGRLGVGLVRMREVGVGTALRRLLLLEGRAQDRQAANLGGRQRTARGAGSGDAGRGAAHRTTIIVAAAAAAADGRRGQLPPLGALDDPLHLVGEGIIGLVAAAGGR